MHFSNCASQKNICDFVNWLSNGGKKLVRKAPESRIFDLLNRQKPTELLIHRVNDFYRSHTHLICLMNIYPSSCHFTLVTKPSLDLLHGYASLFEFCGVRMSECVEIKSFIPQLMMDDAGIVLHDTRLYIGAIFPHRNQMNFFSSAYCVDIYKPVLSTV